MQHVLNSTTRLRHNNVSEAAEAVTLPLYNNREIEPMAIALKAGLANGLLVIIKQYRYICNSIVITDSVARDLGLTGAENWDIWWGLGGGYMRGVAYDTAQVTRFSDGLNVSSLLWLLSNQNKDGSWGGEVPYFHDRVISTLSAIICLASINKEKFAKKIRLGEDFLWENIDKLRYEPYATVGFELLFPRLMKDAAKLGLDVPPFRLYYYRGMDEKMMGILSELLYTGRTTLSFSAEFMGDIIDRERAVNIISQYGTAGGSPSATAYLLRYVKSPKAIKYLSNVAYMNKDGSIVDVQPFELFEKAWMIYNYRLAGLPVTDLIRENLIYLKESWGNLGVGISRYVEVPDSDDTAMVFRVLSDFNINLSPKVFEYFELRDRFKCFQFERDPSISANAHILDALVNYKGRYERRDSLIEKALKFLGRRMSNQGYWIDKWHISPYYATSHAVIAVLRVDPQIAEAAIDWIISTQNPDGSWGIAGGSHEETAYALQALLYYDRYERVDSDIIERGISYLSTYDDKRVKLPALWIGKGLYCPENVVKSAIYSALWMYKKRREAVREWASRESARA